MRQESGKSRVFESMTHPNLDHLPRNPVLCAALEAYVHSGGSIKGQEDVLQAVLDSTLIFPSVSEAPGRLALAFIREPNGNLLTPAFTDARALLAWAPSGHSVSTADATFFIPAIQASPTSGIVLNPGGKASVVLDRRTLENLAARLEQS